MNTTTTKEISIMTTTASKRIVRTNEKAGRFYVYRYGDLQWWRCPDGFGPEWYVCRVDENNEQIGDGDYIDFNPANSLNTARRIVTHTGYEYPAEQTA